MRALASVKGLRKCASRYLKEELQQSIREGSVPERCFGVLLGSVLSGPVAVGGQQQSGFLPHSLARSFAYRGALFLKVTLMWQLRNFWALYLRPRQEE